MQQDIQYFPWQKNQWAKVRYQVDQNRLAHAYLFAGAKGMGKSQFAIALAASLMCEAPDTMGHACGQCKPCTLYINQSHPDIRYVVPEEGSKLIKIDQIREMNEFMMKSGHQGGRKIVIISPAEKMNVNAANALLKTLEEPTPNSLLILLTDKVGSLLPTIRSRCQVVDFPVPSETESMQWLKNELGEVQEENSIKACLRLASGSPLLSLHLLQEGGIGINEQMLEGLSQVLKRESTISQIAQSWVEGDAATYLSWMMAWLNQTIKFKLTSDESQIYDDSARKMLVFLAEKNDVDALFILLEKLQSQYLLANGSNNPNLQLMYEFVLSEWMQIMPGRS